MSLSGLVVGDVAVEEVEEAEEDDVGVGDDDVDVDGR